MGCDIHGVFQKRTADGWQDVPTTYEEGRHYFLFAVLAGVRNGFGFAGIPTHTPVVPIAEPRGLPDDFAVEGCDTHTVSGVEILGWRTKYRSEDEPLEIWMGDHSHSWLTADEILAYASKNSESAVQRRGILSINAYREWDKTSAPEAYCGGVSGPGVKVSLPSEIAEDTTHVECKWVVGGMSEISYFTSEVQRLKDEHGEVRFVFGFDS